MSARLRMHLMTARGMQRTERDVDVGAGITLQELLKRLDKDKISEKGLFRSILRGKTGITLLLNGERLDLQEDKNRKIRNDDELVLLTPFTGG